jgi:transcription antitermination factor NusG
MPLLSAEPDIYPADLLEQSTLEAKKWWAVYTLSRHEKQLCRLLLRKEVSFYCPVIATRYRSPAGRARVSHLPLFANYVFLHGDEDDRYEAVATGCVSRCLSVTDGPALLADLLQIKRLIDLGAPLTPEDKLQPGMAVRVKTGPMRGLMGQVLERRGERRLLVAVNFIQRGASLDLADWEVERIH